MYLEKRFEMRPELRKSVLKQPKRASEYRYTGLSQTGTGIPVPLVPVTVYAQRRASQEPNTFKKKSKHEMAIR